ncbi:DUF559 domain-containing protein [Paenibacillus planticolens]|uniref:DUF559 domain-containing protein n=1 Tax=Paenibacillus planticolens TaxID=2654976 RepID=A0ABX1ZPC7_9BACL|nr:DUF559 domain-containing protein [Paenibacillus planticolens]NOV01478.1 DUF559 domain-containing protein [Paenibacillus planticolens]
MTFNDAHTAFIRLHSENRSGERRGRLERGHGHGETLFLNNVWWPLRVSFKDLHPEYEVLDWRGKSYFADFSWLPGYVKLLIEIKGYTAHVRDMDRQKYCYELNRETFLHAIGFHVISFAYDDVEQRPDLCITLLRMVLSNYQPSHAPISRAQLAEKEIIRLAIERSHSLRPLDVARHLEINHKTAVLILKRMCAKGQLLPSYGDNQERVVRYELAKEVLAYF